MGSSFLQHLLHLLCEEIVTQQYEVTFPSCTRKFFHLNWNGQLETEGVHGPTERHDGWQVWQQGKKEMENKSGQLKVGQTICFSLKWCTTTLKLHRKGGGVV